MDRVTQTPTNHKDASHRLGALGAKAEGDVASTCTCLSMQVAVKISYFQKG